MERPYRHTSFLSCNQWYLIVRMEEIELSGIPIIPASNNFCNSSIHEYSTTFEALTVFTGGTPPDRSPSRPRQHVEQ